MSDLAHYLRISYGLGPSEPTDGQVRAISDDIRQFAKAHGREPSTDELGGIVKRHCPSYQTHKYAADVNLPLRQQIAQLISQAKK